MMPSNFQCRVYLLFCSLCFLFWLFCGSIDVFCQQMSLGATLNLGCLHLWLPDQMLDSRELADSSYSYKMYCISVHSRCLKLCRSWRVGKFPINLSTFMQALIAGTLPSNYSLQKPSLQLASSSSSQLVPATGSQLPGKVHSQLSGLLYCSLRSVPACLPIHWSQPPVTSII